MTVEQKADVLSGLGVDKLALLPFTRELSSREPEDFAREILAEALGARRVVLGSNFRFGRGRRGDVPLLVRLGRDLGFDVFAVEPLWHDGAPISSSRIREALARGAVGPARELLGRAFFVDGEVVRGEERGRKLGIPTVNLALRNEALLRPGVYAGFATILGDDVQHLAVANLGRRPTFGGGETTLEAHLLDFDGDLYGRSMRLAFREFLRDERRFDGPEALVRQIRDDIATARRVLGEGAPGSLEMP
jgi:riboflavin kinase/FMN adenylyltransferase